MNDLAVVVVDKLLDSKWAAQAQLILAHGEREGRFHISMSSLHGGRKRALFAFLGEESDAEDAVGVMTYVTFGNAGDRKIFRMDLLSVHSGHRRDGIGEALVDRAYALAVQLGCREVDALVSTFNFPMMRLTQKSGFNQEVVRMWRNVKENQPPDDWDF